MDSDWERTLNEDVPRLAEVLRREGLEEIEIADERRSVRLRRAAAAMSEEDAAIDAAAADDAATTLTVSSEHVGVFHRAREGEVDPVVAEESAVEEGQTLAFIDVLGVEYDVVAPQAGVISSFHVRDGQPVAYGDRLAEMAPPPAAEDGPALTA